MMPGMSDAIEAAPAAQRASLLAASVAAPRGRVRLRTLILLRWAAIAGQLAALLIVRYGLGFDLPIGPALAIVGASGLLNLWATWPWPSGRRRTMQLGDRAAVAYLGFDLLQLAALLYLTGGLHNPFAVLILAPVTVSATILSRTSTVALSLLAIVAIVLLALFHMPLPWPDPGFTLQPIFVTGFGVALTVAVVFIAAYVFSVAEESRRMSDALSATQLALAKEQRRSALGALAAATAHSLGTPLATIALVAKEIARDLPPDSPIAGDVELLLSESARCREILTGLSTRPEASDESGPMPAKALIESVAEPFHTGRVRLAVEVEPAARAAQLPPRPDIVHGLGNLIENAFEFARTTVRVAIRSGGEDLVIDIADDGAGFDPGLIGRLGEPYLSGGPQGREGKDVHMGLGVFIAQTLLGQSGASVLFRNMAHGGAAVTVSWSRTALQSLYQDSGSGA
jgi:two-component system sensor histidine kinase RegB